MRDWSAYVRSHLSLPGLTPVREARIIRELAAQLEDFYREARAGGASEDEADAHARAQVRDWTRMARDVLQADAMHARSRMDLITDRLEVSPPHRRGVLQMLAQTLTDTRYGVRQLIKTPGFTIVAILTLAFGIGATTAIFSVVNGVMFRPLPFPDAGRLVRVLEVVPQYGRFSVAPANFFDWRQQNQSFERIGTYTGGNATYVGADGPDRIPMAAVSWDMFELLGVRPAMGRGFKPEEDLPNQNNVLVIGHGMWQRRFGGDPNILGRTITLNGTPSTIVGVMPPDFYFPSRDAEFWQPIALNPANATRGGHFLGVIARLKPGVTIEQAHSEMKTIAERLAVQYPQNSADESAEVIGALDLMIGTVRPMLWTLLAAVGVVILIVCANIANLLLARGSVRSKEIAIRAAMGAGRGRLAAQMLVESLVLALAGGALGVLLAYLALPAIQSLGTGSIPRVADISIDRTVLLFTVAVTVATGLLFGLVPAWQASRGTLGHVLKEGGRSSAASGGRWMRGGLLVAEVALSIVLLVGAALLLRSFAKLTGIDPGFRPERVLTFRVALPQVAYPQEYNRIQFYDRLLERLRTAPGIEHAGMVQTLPLRGDYVLSFVIQGRPPLPPGQGHSANHRVVSPGYFQTLGIPLLKGRYLADTDAEKSPMVAVVDQAFVRTHFPDEDPIGRGIDIGNGTDGFYEIVGVVGDVHHDGLEAEADATMYIPYKQDVFSSMAMLVRTAGDPAAHTGTVRQIVRELDSSLPAYAITPLDVVVSESVAERRFTMLLLGLFALVALFLAAVGLYGVVAYTVSQRTQEIGVRMAIGAQRGDVLRLILGGGMKLAALGTIIGIVAALALASYIASLLFGVTAFDPASYAATAAVLLAVAALACYVPARRAMAVDPLVALRQE